MNIFALLIFAIEAVLGVGSCVVIIGLLLITIAQKIMNKVRYGKSLYS